MRICPKCRALYPDYANVCPLDGTQLVQPGVKDPLVGVTLDDRYMIQSRIGEGGMGAVYVARHKVLEKLFAVKVLRKEFASDRDAALRFIEEARATSRIGHENIIDVTDFGNTPEGSLYIVMEYLPGENLAQVTKRCGALEIGRCTKIWKQITAALGAAHSNGIIHRDLKPENILLAEKGGKKDVVKVLDFGIAKIISGQDQETRRTTAGMVLGTPAFMSPEQASGAPVDTRTDIYSLGVIMYETATGRLPFDHQNPLTILVMHQTHPVPPPRSIRPQIPEPIEQTILKCLEKSPDLRFGTMEDLQSAIDAAEKGIAAFHDSSLMPVKALSKEEIDRNRAALFANPGEVWYDPFEKPACDTPPATKATPAPPRASGPPAPVTAAGLELARKPEDIKRKTYPGGAEIEGFAARTDPKKSGKSWRPLVYGLLAGAALFVLVRSYFLIEPATPVPLKEPHAARPAPATPPPAEEKSFAAVQEGAAAAEELIKARRYGEAAGYFRELIAIRPTYAPLHRGLGRALEKLGDTGGAMAAYRRYLELAPQAADRNELNAYITRHTQPAR